MHRCFGQCCKSESQSNEETNLADKAEELHGGDVRHEVGQIPGEMVMMWLSSASEADVRD